MNGLSKSIEKLCARALALCMAVIVVAPRAVGADPYIPNSDDEVLETLPRVLLTERDGLTTLRRQLANDPNNATLASTVAQRYLRMGEPRYYGYARAAIGPWWQADSPPASILSIRAELKEQDHQYDQAIVDLQKLLDQQPRNAQAHLELANIHRLLGNYGDARQVCDVLSDFAGSIPTTICRAPIDAVTGESSQAYDDLVEILPLVKKHLLATAPWVMTRQAEIAWAMERNGDAQRHFREAQAADSDDGYMLRSYADFLLDQGDAQAVLDLLQERTRDTGVLLRAAIAARRVGKTELAAKWKTELANRFAEIRLRGGEPHGRYEARFALELQDDPKQALALALANWHKQKEIRDTRNVLEAAVATNDPDAVKPVLDFLSKNGTEHVVLDRLIIQLRSMKAE